MTQEQPQWAEFNVVKLILGEKRTEPLEPPEISYSLILSNGNRITIYRHVEKYHCRNLKLSEKQEDGLIPIYTDEFDTLEEAKEYAEQLWRERE